MTRAEHVAWCKSRALEYARAGNLSDAAMSVTHHDAGDHEPGFIREVRSMERKFAGLLRGKLKPRWAGRAALKPETPDHG